MELSWQPSKIKRSVLICLVVQLLCFGLYLTRRSFYNVSLWRQTSQTDGPSTPNLEVLHEMGALGENNRGNFADKMEKGVLVAVLRNNSDAGWIQNVPAASWSPKFYNVDLPYRGEGTSTVMKNKGHEAMVYLTWIIDNHHNLPPLSAFIHGHLDSWHQETDIISALGSIRLPVVQEQGYINLRCDWYPSCPAEIKPITHDAHVWGPGVHRQDAEDAISGGAWQTFFPGVPLPETIASQCCAQFIVTRMAIQRHSRDVYLRMRQWLLETDLHDDISGRVLEKLWAYIFTGDPVQ